MFDVKQGVSKKMMRDERYIYDPLCGVKDDDNYIHVTPMFSMALRIKRITVRHGQRIDGMRIFYTPLNTELQGEQKFECNIGSGGEGGQENSIEFGENEYVSEITLFTYSGNGRGLSGMAIRKNQEQPQCFGVTDPSDSRKPRDWAVVQEHKSLYYYTGNRTNDSRLFIGFHGYHDLQHRYFMQLGGVASNQSIIRTWGNFILQSTQSSKFALCMPKEQEIYIDRPFGNDTVTRVYAITDVFARDHEVLKKNSVDSLKVHKGLQYFIVERGNLEPVCGTGWFKVMQVGDSLEQVMLAMLTHFVEEYSYHVQDDWIRLDSNAIVTLNINTALQQDKPHVFVTYRDADNKNKVTIDLISSDQKISGKYLYGTLENNDKLYLSCSKEYSSQACFYVKVYCSHQFEMSTDSLWQDYDFQANEYHIRDVERSIKHPYEWLRPDKYASSVRTNVAPSDSYNYSIEQGEVGDCYLIEAFYELLEQETYWTEHQKTTHDNWKELHKRISDIVKFDTKRPGRATVTMKLQGVERDIELDDRIPCLLRDNTPEPMFAHLVHIDDTSRGWEYQWVALLEKAFAKVAGSYFWLQGMFKSEKRNRRERIKPFYSLLGALPCPKVLLNSTFKRVEEARNQNTDASWQKLQTMFKPDGVRTYGGMASSIIIENFIMDDDVTYWKQKFKDVGLVDGHAYSVVQVFEIGDNKIVQLRNPYGESSWRGDWSDNDTTHWTEQNISEYENKFHLVAKYATNTRRRHAFKATSRTDVDSQINGGIFFMSMKDFATYYTDVIPHRLMSPENNHNWRMEVRHSDRREQHITIAAQDSTELELVIFKDSDPKAKFVPIDEQDFKLSAVASTRGSNWQKPSDVSFKFWGGMLRSELMTWHNESHTITIKNPEARPYTLEVHWRHHKDKHGLDVGYFN